jgi:hypothetical protein
MAGVYFGISGRHAYRHQGEIAEKAIHGGTVFGLDHNNSTTLKHTGFLFQPLDSNDSYGTIHLTINLHSFII